MSSYGEMTRREAIKAAKERTMDMLKDYDDHQVIEGIMEALPRLPKFVKHKNIMNSLESRVVASKGKSNGTMELRGALEIVFDEEVEAIPQPNEYFGVKCYLGNIFFPKAFLDTRLASSLITFHVFKKLHKAELKWDKPGMMVHDGQQLKVYEVMENYHVHIGCSMYLMNLMVVKHMNAKAKLSKHDLVFGRDLFFTTSPRFNLSNEPLKLENSQEIEVNFFEDGNFEDNGRSFIVIPTLRRCTWNMEKPLPKRNDIEEGEFLEGDYVESDSELEAYYSAQIDAWIEDVEVEERGVDEILKESKLGEKKKVKKVHKPNFAAKYVKEGIPVVELSSDEDSDDDNNHEWRSLLKARGVKKVIFKETEEFMME